TDGDVHRPRVPWGLLFGQSFWPALYPRRVERMARGLPSPAPWALGQYAPAPAPLSEPTLRRSAPLPQQPDGSRTWAHLSPRHRRRISRVADSKLAQHGEFSRRCRAKVTLCILLLLPDGPSRAPCCSWNDSARRRLSTCQARRIFKLAQRGCAL